MIQLARAMLGSYYDMEVHNIYKQEELREKLEKFDPYQVLAVDEAISGLFKRDFAKKQQKDIIKMLNMYRDKFFTIFLTLPNFWDLDSAIRTSMIIKYWIYCFKRGEAIIFTHDKNPGSFDPFNRKLIYSYWKAGKIWKSPYYCGSIVWKDIDKDLYNKYKLIKARKRRLEDLEKEVKEEKKKIEKVKAFEFDKYHNSD